MQNTVNTIGVDLPKISGVRSEGLCVKTVKVHFCIRVRATEVGPVGLLLKTKGWYPGGGIRPRASDAISQPRGMDALRTGDVAVAVVLFAVVATAATCGGRE